MEKLLKIHVQKLPEGLYLATSDELPGLVAQGRTVTETLEIARDVARKLMEAKTERENNEVDLSTIQEEFDYALIVNN
jgi:predicted RNase H-like HicB family nuclease